jgi:hypothetical protein
MNPNRTEAKPMGIASWGHAVFAAMVGLGIRRLDGSGFLPWHALARRGQALAPSPGTSICNREGIAFRRILKGGPCPDATPAWRNLPKLFFWNF